MADFDSTVDKLASTVSKFDKAVKVMGGSGAVSQKPAGAAAAEDAREQRMAAAKTNTLLEGILKGVTKGMPGASGKEKKPKFNFGAMMGGIGLAGMATAALGAIKSGILGALGLVAKGGLFLLKAPFKLAAAGLGKLASAASGLIRSGVSAVWKVAAPVLKPVGTFLSNLASTAGGLVKSSLNSVWGVVKGGAGKVLDLGKGAVGGVKNIASAASSRISNALSTVWGSAKGAGGKAISLVKQLGMKAGGGAVNIARNAANSISGALGSIFKTGSGVAAKGGAGLAKAGGGLLKMMGGAARFAGPIGLAVTAGMGIIGGVTAGIEEYKKSGDFGKAIKEGSAGALSTLTFGLISQETFSSAFTAIGDKFSSLTTGVKDVASKAWEGAKNLIPTKESLKKNFEEIGNKLSPLKELTIPKEISFSAVKDAVTTNANAINSAFKNITGIDVKKSLGDIGSQVTTKLSAMKTGFEDITGIKVPTFSEIQDKMTKMGTRVKDKFEDITGIKVPSFTEMGNKITDMLPAIGNPLRKLADGLKGTMNLEEISSWLPDWSIGDALSGVITKIVGEGVEKMAGGGSVKAGVPYMVGEQGPELIIPNGAATVKTASQTSQMMQAGLNRQGGAGGGNVNTIVGGSPVTTNNNNSYTSSEKPSINPTSVFGLANTAAYAYE